MSSTSHAGDIPPLTFDEALDREIELIAAARAPGADPQVGRDTTRDSLVGLALSGGGIRSATFNLGVLQGLARLRLLRRFDYLSTVSGGGYIGGFLSALIHREGQGRAENIEASLSGRDADGEAEHYAVRFLRAHSNYLTPKVGLLSADTMTAVAIYVRNLVLNLLLLVATLACLLLGIRFVGWLSHVLVPAGAAWTLGLAALTLLVAIVVCAVNLCHTTAGARCSRSGEWWFVAIGVVGFAGISAWMLSHYLWIAARADHQRWDWALIVAVGYTLCWGIGIVAGLLFGRAAAGDDAVQRAALRKRSLKWWAAAVFFALVAGAAGGVLFKLIADAYQAAWGALWVRGVNTGVAWMVPAFGAAAVFLVFMFVVTLHIGLVGRQFSEEQREWWGRVGAYCNAWVLGWLGLFGFAYLATPVVDAAGIAAGSIGFASLVTTIAGVLAAGSERTGGDPNRRALWMDVLARVAPYVFVVAILFLLGWCIEQLLTALIGPGPCPAWIGASDTFLEIMDKRACTASREAIHMVLPVLGAAAAIALLLSARININLFSYHQFYRYRLTRCYLGATQPDRNPHPLTGLDPDDDLQLAALTQRPYHILNTALNLAAGRQLAWQTRKSASFVLSPLHCGYFRASTRQQRGNYRPTILYGAKDRPGGYRLGAAVATSGAAASPTMGFHTSAPVAFLLTVFNVRLGRWSPNPAERAWDGPSDPGSSLAYLLTELIGAADLRRDYVYLSDGGHFENTGIYELVRRRCRVIVATDCGADPAGRFEDVANAIRRCRVDLGAAIEIDLAPLRRADGSGWTAAHHAIGTIAYDNGSTGTLIVLKPTLNDRVPAEVLAYAAKNRSFPQQSTADQWFNEDQFESYRRLGEHVTLSAMAQARRHIDQTAGA